jgi:hypothetical protein
MDVQTAIKVQTHPQSGIHADSFLQGFPANPLFPTTIRDPERIVGYPEIMLLRPPAPIVSVFPVHSFGGSAACLWPPENRWEICVEHADHNHNG